MRKKDSILTWIEIILTFVLIFGVAFGYGYALVEYGNKPINEVPTWVLWLLK